MDHNTIKFTVPDDSSEEMKVILTSVYRSLSEKGYNPINQIVGYQLTDPNVRAKDRVVKKSEKDGFYTALDVGCVWLERALASK